MIDVRRIFKVFMDFNSYIASNTKASLSMALACPRKLNHSKDFKRFAFTLAETLITLTIIGIIAAMTVPNIINNANQHAYISKYRKTYSVLKNAWLLYVRENDFNPPHLGGNYADNMIKMLKTKLKAVEDDFTGLDNIPTEYNNGKGIKALNGKDVPIRNTKNTRQGAILLADGTQLNITCGHAHWVSEVYVKDFVGDYSCSFWIDVNGETKAPNVLGKDIFYVVALHDDLHAWPVPNKYKSFWIAPINDIHSNTGIDRAAKHATCKKNESEGYGCSSWFLTHTDYEK